MAGETLNYTDYLQNKASVVLANLEVDKKPTFGIMSPQHMVEHLIVSIKFSLKDRGEQPESPTEGQEQFKKFIFSDAPFQKGDPAKAKLAELKFANLDEARTDLVNTIGKFYQFFEENPNATPYNDFFGALSKEELERFHYKHFQHHFRQFELI